MHSLTAVLADALITRRAVEEEQASEWQTLALRLSLSKLKLRKEGKTLSPCLSKSSSNSSDLSVGSAATTQSREWYEKVCIVLERSRSREPTTPSLRQLSSPRAELASPPLRSCLRCQTPPLPAWAQDRPKQVTVREILTFSYVEVDEELEL